MSPIPLTYELVKQAARLAYDENRLSAQGPKPACMYVDKVGRPCAVGAAIPPGAILDRDEHETVLTLVTRRVLTISDEDFPKIRALQRAHDRWARGELGGEAQFRSLIGYPSTKETTPNEAHPD